MVRQHEEFVWLHDRYEENEDYAGIVVSLFLFKEKLNITLNFVSSGPISKMDVRWLTDGDLL